MKIRPTFKWEILFFSSFGRSQILFQPKLTVSYVLGGSISLLRDELFAHGPITRPCGTLTLKQERTDKVPNETRPFR